MYIGVLDSYRSVLPSGVSTEDLRFVFQETGVLAAPVEKNTPFGVVNVYYGSTCVVSAPLYALNKVTLLENDLITERFEDETDGMSVGLILAIVAGVFVALLLLLRYNKRVRAIVGRKHRRKRNV